MIQIENYISSFLLKNKYCAISGLGTLELKRDMAFTREDGNLNPPNYNITFSPIGVIDDGFATFIANHENVSISKASNDIKTFTQDVKRELHKTGRYEIDGVGHFTHKNDTIQFYQDETLDLERDPIQLYREKAPDTEEEEETLADAKSFKDLHFTHAESGVGKPKMGTLLKYLLALLLLIGLAAAAYFGYKYFEGSGGGTVNTAEEASSVEDFEEAPTLTDSTTITEGINQAEGADSSTSVTDEPIVEAAPVAAAAGEYKIAVKAYDNAASAKMKAETLASYGNKTTIVQKGNVHYLVLIASHPTNDTIALKDSLRRFFNPSGTPFIVK